MINLRSFQSSACTPLWYLVSVLEQELIKAKDDTNDTMKKLREVDKTCSQLQQNLEKVFYNYLKDLCCLIAIFFFPITNNSCTWLLSSCIYHLACQKAALHSFFFSNMFLNCYASFWSLPDLKEMFCEYKFGGKALQFRGWESCTASKSIEFSEGQLSWFCQAIFGGKIWFSHYFTSTFMCTCI